MDAMTTMILPTACPTTPVVTVPALRPLKVAAFTSAETGTFYAPVSAEFARKAPANEQTTVSIAKTVRPARRRAVA